MGYPTDIEWTDATWNPIGGCSVRSPGCRPCYAMQLAGTRLAHHPLYRGTTDKVKGRPVFNGTMTALPPDHDGWLWPLRWKGAANRKLGLDMPSLIFVGDMSDLFHENRDVLVSNRVVDAVIRSEHVGQLLTKRPEFMLWYFLDLRERADPDYWTRTVRKLWLGISAERQREFDERWPYLRVLAEMGFTVFVSYEPALGPVALPEDALALGDRLQVIAGGTSGKRATPPKPEWFRGARDQCAGTGVAFFFKQWGEWASADVIGYPTGTRPVAWPDSDGPAMVRVGKKKAGALLDGRLHRAFPRLAA